MRGKWTIIGSLLKKKKLFKQGSQVFGFLSRKEGKFKEEITSKTARSSWTEANIGQLGKEKTW